MCCRRALVALSGLGDWRHEWHEWSGAAYHVRRRLTETEADSVGPVRDIRRTVEAQVRAAELGARLSLVPAHVRAEELG